MKATIQTYSGVMFDLADPQPHMVNIIDVAHSLARTCRYSGHTTGFYSVAQHSILVLELTKVIWPVWCRYVGDLNRSISNDILRQALLHDAHEAYVGDVTTPLKRLLGDKFREVEGKIWNAVAEALRIDPNIHPVVKIADMSALHVERRHVLTPSYERWFYEDSPDFIELGINNLIDRSGIEIVGPPMGHTEIEDEFLRQLLALR